MNKLNGLPRGFGAFPALEVLDLTYNNLSEKSLPGNFFILGKSAHSTIVELILGFYYLCFACKFNILATTCVHTYAPTLSETLRALYLGDNDFEYLPAEIGNLKSLQIVSIGQILIGQLGLADKYRKILTCCLSWWFVTTT